MRLINNEKGSVTIELSMFIAVICGLVFGYMAIMNGAKAQIALQVAAREGAREYATTLNMSNGIAKAKNELALMGVSGASCNALADGDMLSLTATKQYSYTIPLFGTYNKTLKGYCSFYEEPAGD